MTARYLLFISEYDVINLNNILVYRYQGNPNIFIRAYADDQASKHINKP